MFALARKVPQATASMKKGEWEKKKFMGVEITGKTLGVVGFGQHRPSGRRTRRGPAHEGSGPRSGLAGRRLRPRGHRTGWLRRADHRRADFISLHLPFLPSTKGLFGADNLRKMKKGAYLINCARGGIVDETALYEVLKSGHLGGAALDVFEKEPCGPLPLFELDNVVASPHIGASTKEAQEKVAVELAEVFVDFFKTGKVRNAVNQALTTRVP